MDDTIVSVENKLKKGDDEPPTASKTTIYRSQLVILENQGQKLTPTTQLK